MLYEGIVLLGGAAREGCEPVGVVTRAVVDGPAPHSFGHRVGKLAAYGLFVDNRTLQSIVGMLRKIFEHLAAVEHKLAIILFGAFGGCGYRHGLTVEGFLDHLEP